MSPPSSPALNSGIDREGCDSQGEGGKLFHSEGPLGDGVWALPASQDRAGGASPLSPFGSQPKALIPSAVCVGFTGTQQGCTPAQSLTLGGWLGALWVAGFEWMRNGDCVGADELAGRTWKDTLGLKLCLHPPVIRTKRAFLPHDEACDPLPYLERNRDIVDASAVLVATPGEMTEQLRSGTWSTVRYARRRRKPFCIVWPDGSYSHENGFAQAIEAREGRDPQGLDAQHESAVGGNADAPKGEA